MARVWRRRRGDGGGEVRMRQGMVGCCVDQWRVASGHSRGLRCGLPWALPNNELLSAAPFLKGAALFIWSTLSSISGPPIRGYHG